MICGDCGNEIPNHCMECLRYVDTSNAYTDEQRNLSAEIDRLQASYHHEDDLMHRYNKEKFLGFGQKKLDRQVETVQAAANLYQSAKKTMIEKYRR